MRSLVKSLQTSVLRLKEWWSSLASGGRLFPDRRTLHRDSREWQERVRELVNSRQALEDRLAEASMAARAAGVPQPEEVGLLKQAKHEIQKSYDRTLIQKYQAISQAFAILSPGKKGSPPESLQNLIKEYTFRIQQIIQDYEIISNRLQLVINLLHQSLQQKPWATALSHRLLLGHPEIYQELLKIEELRWENRQIAVKRMQNSFQRRLHIGKMWLNILENHISSYAYRLGMRTIKELSTSFSEHEDELNYLINLHRRLDTPLLNWNRQSLQRLN